MIVGEILSVDKQPFIFMGLAQFQLDEIAAGMDPEVFGLRPGIFGVAMSGKEVSHLDEFQLYEG